VENVLYKNFTALHFLIRIHFVLALLCSKIFILKKKVSQELFATAKCFNN